MVGIEQTTSTKTPAKKVSKADKLAFIEEQIKEGEGQITLKEFNRNYTDKFGGQPGALKTLIEENFQIDVEKKSGSRSIKTISMRE